MSTIITFFYEQTPANENKNLKRMKNIILILMVFLVGIHPKLKGQDEKKHDVNTEIESVIVYLDGSEITRIKDVQLTKGRNRIFFKGLSPRLEDGSIRVTVPVEIEKDVAVLSVSHKIDYLTKTEEQPRIKQIRDSIANIDLKLIAIRDDLNALDIEKEMLLKNQSLKGEQNGVSITELKLAADFFRERINEINRKITENKIKEKKLSQTNNRLKYQLREVNAELSYSRSEVNVLVNAKSNIKIPFELKYIVSQSGWSPIYDLKATEIEKPVELIYRANVYNNTKIDWKDIKMTLSTADPRQTASKPELKTWHLKYYQPLNVGNNKLKYFQNMEMKKSKGRKQGQIQQNMMLQQNNSPTTGEFEGYFGGADNLPAGLNDKIDDVFEVEINDFNAEFEIPEAYSVPSDNKPYIVEVSKHSLPANYKHYVVPKMDKDAFLIAQITGWEDLDMVEGPANIYFAGTYVGKSYINTRNVKDTLDLSLGRDKKVLVSRTKVKEYSSTSFIGSKRKEMLSYEIVVKNNRKKNIDITVLDQVPVSQNSEIEVEVHDTSGAQYNDLSGKLTWKLNIGPAEAKKLKLSFSIRYPKNRQVQTEQVQKRSLRMF